MTTTGEAMPHVLIKTVPGKSDDQKRQLAEAITRDIQQILHYDEAEVSIAIQEVPKADWAESVYRHDIRPNLATLYKKPGYTL